MSKDRISLGGRPFKPAEVEMFGVLFNTRAVTKSLGKQIDDLDLKLAEAEQMDEVIVAMGEILNTYLVPTGGGKKKPSALLKEKWDADEVTLPEINGFFEDLRGRVTERPT